MSFIKHLIAAACVVAAPVAAHAFAFIPDNYYASTGSVIEQLGADGSLIDTIRPIGPGSSGTELRGLAFGGDGNLYVVRGNDFVGAGVGNASVDVMNSTGEVVHTYAFPGWISGLATEGQIAFAHNGQSFYVGSSDGIYQFEVGGNTGTRITNQEANSIAIMPNGDLLASSGYALYRYASDGTQINTIGRNIQDPQGLTAAFNDFRDVPLTDVRGIAYDAQTDTTFVTMLGYSGGIQTEMNFKILALDGFSPVLKGIGDYWYGAQMQFMGDGQLLVGSWTQAPGVFDANLNLVRQFGGSSAVFATMGPVPEPSGTMLFGLGLMGLLGAPAWQRRKR